MTKEFEDIDKFQVSCWVRSSYGGGKWPFILWFRDSCIGDVFESGKKSWYECRRIEGRGGKDCWVGETHVIIHWTWWWREEQPARKTRRRAAPQTPKPIKMKVAGFKTGKTPVERDNEGDDAFKLRCEICIGIYYGKMVQIQTSRKFWRMIVSEEYASTLERRPTSFVLLCWLSWNALLY